MTECERLIANGTFTRDFFKPEVRCNFLVDEKRKKIWAIQLDLLSQFDMVCSRHGLTYFAIGGTILGALRHGGFIPWDDDIDLVMPRTDYLQFLDCADEFKSPYYLQIPGHDHEYAYSLTKLRNSNTTQMSKAFSHCGFNQGVMIDIIPIDRWCHAEGRSVYGRINELNVDNSNFMYQGSPTKDEQTLSRLQAWSGRSIHDNLHEIDLLATMFEDDPRADRYTPPVTTMYPYEKIVFFHKWFAELKRVRFENTTIPIPCEAEQIMEMQFGSWRKFPPIQSRGTWHDGLVVDPDRPYSEYLI